MPISRRRRGALAVPALFALFVAGCGDDGSDAATVTLETPADGATIAGGVDLFMRADGIAIEEAGEVRDGAGHFHVIADDGCVEPGEAVPRDADHVHFGAGQSEGTIYLEPGAHELCLQAADGAHVALDVTDTVDIEVGITDRDQWCAVVTEIDELFATGDLDGEDFPTVQAAAENARRLFTQVTDGIEHVDANVRDDVADEVEFGLTFVSAFVDADGFDDVEAALQSVFGTEGRQSDGPGSTWILDTCGVDIDD